MPLGRLTKPQQLYLLRHLPIAHKRKIEGVCLQCRMKGEGLKDILKKVAKALGAVAKVVGPVALKEFVVPMLKKKLLGKGLVLAGQGRGRGLKLAGQGRKKKPKKKPRKKL